MSLSSPRKTITRRRLALYGMTLAGVLFRSEIAILLVAHTGYLFLRHKPGTRQAFVTSTVLPAGLFGLFMGLLITVPLDTYFWQAPTILWPELKGFIYNTIEGHASEWGVSSAHHYVTNAIPRLLLNPASYLVCIPLALWTKSTRTMSLDIGTPLAVFIAVYSLLPHKEWRFIIYITPSLTAIAAAGAAWIWTRRSKVVMYRILAPILALSVVVSLASSLVLLGISAQNYPGADSLVRLHEMVETRQLTISPRTSGEINIYLDNLACQTGVTRFLQRHNNQYRDERANSSVTVQPRPIWRYEKTTDKTRLLNPLFWEDFDYVIAEDPGRVIGSWQIAVTIRGYAGLSLRDLPDTALSDAGGSRAGAPILGSRSLAQALRRSQDRYGEWSGTVQQRFTRGYWPRVKLEDKLFILARSESR